MFTTTSAASSWPAASATAPVASTSSLDGLTDGVVYRVEAPDTGLAAQTFTLDAHTENYGAPVIFYDNVYSSFMVVPEPGGMLLCLVAALHALARRSRRRHS
jgi:hypothetical protein